MLFNFFHVAALAGIFRRDGFLAEGAGAPMLEHAAWRFARNFGGDMDQRFDFRARELAAVARDVVVLLHDFDGLIYAILLSFDGEARVVEVRANLEGIFERRTFSSSVPKNGSI